MACESLIRRESGFGLGPQGGEHGLDRGGAGDGRAGGGQDLTFGWAGVAETPYGYSLALDAEGEGRDEGQAEPGGDEALGGPVFVGFHDPAGCESGVLEGGAGCVAAAADLAPDVDPRLGGRVAERDSPPGGETVAAGNDDPERVAEQRLEGKAAIGCRGDRVGFDDGEVEGAGADQAECRAWSRRRSSMRLTLQDCLIVLKKPSLVLHCL
jgi:hypothetical protein